MLLLIPIINQPHLNESELHSWNNAKKKILLVFLIEKWLLIPCCSFPP